jgi:hypothetical protein
MEALTRAPMRAGLRLALAVVLCCLATGCVFRLGDQTRDVDLVNASNQPLVVYTFDRDERFAMRIAGGQTWTDGWMYPLSADDRRLVSVEADDAKGLRVFCARYSFSDLAALHSRIELKPGVNRCD